MMWVHRFRLFFILSALVAARPTNADPNPPAAPKQVAVHPDSPVKGGGPKFVFSGAADLNHNAWFGTEEEGVWEYANGNWKQFTANQGLGDDTVTAVACDGLGRIWAGQNAHGFSVFNGTTWKNYNRVDGSGGAHVFCIATCPADGDVWIATESGLTRYSMSKDSWSYFNRLDGLPTEQVRSMAFDLTGNLYLGLAAEGVAVAHAADGYSHWTRTLGPRETPIRPNGGGLPSNLINAMLVSRDGTVYAGTSRGLACSVDGGVRWAYVRGKVWPQYAEGRIEGMPDDFDFASRGTLAADDITCLTEDPFGVIWIGHGTAGYQTYLPGAVHADHELGGRYVTSIVPIAAGRCLLSTYGKGVFESTIEYTGPSVPVKAPASALPANAFPTPAPVPDAAALDAMTKRLQSLPAAGGGVALLSDDWETGGDWIASYGSRVASLMGYKTFHTEPGYELAITTGPYRQAAMRYYWDDQPKVPADRLLLDPEKKLRLFCENNDESYDEKTHPRPQEGPDLFLRITLPAGVHRVSLFFQNHDTHSNPSANQRDFVLEVKTPAPDDDADNSDGWGYRGYQQLPPAASTDAELAAPLLTSRVSNFREGVYKRFLFHSAGTWWIKIGRNHSPCTKVSAVFIDRLDVGGKPAEKWFGSKYDLPPETDYSADTGVKGAAQRLWNAVDKAVDRQEYAALADRARIMAYRAGVAAGIDDDTLTLWRQKLLLWTVADRDHFDQAAGLAETPGI